MGENRVGREQESEKKDDLEVTSCESNSLLMRKYKSTGELV